MSGGDAGSRDPAATRCQQALDTLAGHYETAQDGASLRSTPAGRAPRRSTTTPRPARRRSGQSNGGGNGGGSGSTGGGETPEERRDRKQGAAQSDFDDLKERLRQRTRECGEA